MGRILDQRETILRTHTSARRHASSVHLAAATAECHRPLAHGTHAQSDADGYYRALVSYARLPHPVATRHRPCWDRDTDDGREAACKRRQETPRPGARKVY